MTDSSSSIPVLTIDGPSGTGKGTLSILLAQKLGWHYLDSGALYRLLANAANRLHIAVDDQARLVEIAKTLDVRFVMQGEAKDYQPADVAVFWRDEEVNAQLRTEEVAATASKIATIAEVRSALLARQRAFVQAPGLVADGRDMGTVVFPDAPLKLYLTASAEARAARRQKQLLEKGLDDSIARLLKVIVERDKRDSERKTAPLKPAEDAVVIDTTEMNIQQVFEQALKLVQQYFP